MYADCYLIPIKKRNLAAYRKMALLGRKAWLGYGALSYVETVGDELKLPWAASYAKLLKLKKDETCIVAWATYKSKAHRNKVNAKIAADPRMSQTPNPMPFDPKRMHAGGFKVLVAGLQPA